MLCYALPGLCRLANIGAPIVLTSIIFDIVQIATVRWPRVCFIGLLCPNIIQPVSRQFHFAREKIP